MLPKLLFTLARPYAQAVFDFACEHQTLEKWELMLICARNITWDPMISKLLSVVDCIGASELSELFIFIGEHKFDGFGQNFIRILSEYKRLHLIPFILDEFLSLRKKQKMIVQVKVKTSFLLSNSEVLKISSAVNDWCSYNLYVTCKLDPSIIGGVILYVNDLVIDGSIQGRIRRLKHVLGI